MDGSKKAKVMFIAESPTTQDTSIGSTFTGDYGMLLSEMIEKAGYDESDVYKTTLIKCFSAGSVKIGNIAACKDYLEEEISKIKPEVIVPLGAVVTKYLLGNKKISDVRGYVFHRGQFDQTDCEYSAKIIPTYSIQAIIGRPTNLFELQSDVKKAFVVAENGYNPIKINYSFTNKHESVYKILEKVEEFAFDVETTGLNHYKDDVITCSFSIMEGQSVCLPFDEYWFKKIFALPCKKIAHTKFDTKILECRYGIPTNNFYFDTYAAIQLLNDNAGQGLKNLASLYTDIPYYNLDTKIGLRDMDIETVATYNNYDADVTFRLYKLFKQELAVQEFDDLFYHTTMPVNRMLLEIEKEGIDVNIPELKRLSLTKNIEAIDIKIELDTIAPINWGSPKQVGDVLFNQLGLVCPIKTPTGANSTNEKVLKILKISMKHQNFF